MAQSELDQLNSSFTPVEEIAQIHQDLRQAFAKGLTKTLEWRTHQLRQLIYLLQENETALEDALAQDLGKPKTEAQLGELVGARHQALAALKNIKSWIKPQTVKTDLTWVVAHPKTYREPKGVVLIIGTWNYPIALAINPLVGAIAGGNAIVLKLSEQAPAIANLLTRLIPQYLDTRHIRIVNGTVPQNTALLDLHFDHIFFTGSIKVGKIVAQRAAENLTPVTLELGGKCPAIIFDDADFTVTGRRLIWGKAMNVGQTCVAPDHILVSKSSEPKLIESLKQALKEFYPTTSISSTNGRQFSKLVNETQSDRLDKLLRETSGEIVQTDGNFPLTIVRQITGQDVLMREEIFGPVLPILTYDTVTEVLPSINDAEPLAVYVFTAADQNFQLVREGTRSGQLIQNDLLIQFSIPGLPFGGVGKSGTGNYHGYHSFLTFTYERATASLPPWADSLFNTRYPPYTAFKLKLFKSIMAPPKLSGTSNPQSVPISVTSLSKNKNKSWLFKGPVSIAVVLAGLWLLRPKYFSSLVKSLKG